jgi:hypothetical protein
VSPYSTCASKREDVNWADWYAEYVGRERSGKLLTDYIHRPNSVFLPKPNRQRAGTCAVTSTGHANSGARVDARNLLVVPAPNDY